jgi:SAM-dependent methyltransferase
MMPAELKDEKFDVVISKDSLEHYTDPENFMLDIKKYLKPGGKIVIRFGPLWKSPGGGHINYITRFPWAHLLFPESVIMRERKKCRPGESATTFEEYGLNKITFKRFMKIIKKCGFQMDYLKINVVARKSKRKLMLVCNVLRKIPFAGEFFIQNVYCIIH